MNNSLCVCGCKTLVKPVTAASTITALVNEATQLDVYRLTEQSETGGNTAACCTQGAKSSFKDPASCEFDLCPDEHFIPQLGCQGTEKV